ncbi:hypothetical protein AB0D56_27515 [Streptomyces sp. NPDC048209]
MSQAVSYLSWLESAHHEFEALVRKVLGRRSLSPSIGVVRG